MITAHGHDLGATPPGRPLRIAMIGTPWYEMPPDGYGGIEVMVADLINGLVARGHEVVAIGVGRNRTNATSYYATYDTPPSERIFDRWPEIVHAQITQEILTELENTTGIDIIHDHSAAGPLFAPLRSAPTVITTHNPPTGLAGTDHHDIGRWYKHLSGEVSYVAISDAQRELVPDLSWVGTVYNALHVNEFPFQEEKDDFVLYLGRMKPYKGAHHAVAAALATGHRLVMAGRCVDEDEKVYFAEQIAPHVGEGVVWLGEIDNDQKLDLLKRAKAVLFPITWAEPFGLVMIEAMACGTPVVALRYGSVPEVVADGVSGIIRDTPEELPEALEKAFTLSPAACRQHVVDNFDVAAMARGYEQMYYSVLEEQSVSTHPPVVAVPAPLPEVAEQDDDAVVLPAAAGQAVRTIRLDTPLPLSGEAS